MLCRCVRKCFRDNRLWEVGMEEDFSSCPSFFASVVQEEEVKQEIKQEAPPKRSAAKKKSK